MSEEKGVERFDENAALAELERLRDSIVAARRARQQKFDEFDAFVDSFRKPPSPAPTQSRVATGPEPEPPPPVPAQDRAREAVDDPSAAAPQGSNAQAVDAPAAPTRPEALWHRGRFNIRIVSAIAALTVIVLALLAYYTRRPATPSSAADTPARMTPSRAETVVPSPPQRAPDRQAPARAVLVQLRLRRAVWMRVIVDGRKVFEGTANGGERLEYGGDRAIVVRAGNGGDILVTTGNREEPFGEAGQPVTRTFSAR